MNAAYKPIQQQAERLRGRLRDALDAPGSAEGAQLVKLSIDVRETVEADKAPRDIESRIIKVHQILEELQRRENEIISPMDARTLADEYEELRREVRKLSNY